MKKENNPILTITAATIMGFILVPSQSLASVFLGSTLLFASATWGIKYYRQHSKLSHIFRKFKIEFDEMVPELREKKRDKENASTIYRYSIPPGFTLTDFEKTKDAIETFLNKEVNIKEHAKNIIIEVYDEQLEEYDYEIPADKKPIFEIGNGRGNKKPVINFSIWPHLLICGLTGSGKSTFMRMLITTLILKNHLTTLQKEKYTIHLIDLKYGVEFGIFEDCASVENFAKDEKEAKLVIAMFAEEMNKRYKQLYETKAWKLSKTNYDQQILFIDEFAELHDEEAQKMLMSIAAKGRASGLNLVIGTQRPDAKNVMDGLLKCNMSNTVCFRVKDAINSRMVLDQSGAESLRGRGHGIFKSAGIVVEFQAPDLSEERARKLIEVDK